MNCGCYGGSGTMSQNMVLNNNFHKHFLHKIMFYDFMSTSAHFMIINNNYCINTQVHPTQYWVDTLDSYNAEGILGT